MRRFDPADADLNHPFICRPCMAALWDERNTRQRPAAHRCPNVFTRTYLRNGRIDEAVDYSCECPSCWPGRWP